MVNCLPSERRLNLHYIAMQAGYWAMFAAICAYQTALLLQRGFTNSDIGLIIAVRCLAGIFAQPALGMFSDRHPELPLKRIVALSLAVSFAAGLFLIRYQLGLAGTLAVFAVMGGLELSAYPLMDAMAIEFINDGIPVRYSLGRGLGSLSYAICCAALGLLTAKLGMEIVLTVHAVLVLVEILVVSTYPTHFPGEPAAQDAPRQAPQSPWALLTTHPRFSVTLLAVLFGILGVIPLSNFLFNIISAKGGGTADLGAGLFLMGAFELPIAILFPRLLRRYGSSKLLALSMGFCALKCLATLLAPGMGWVLAAQSLQMMGYGLFTPSSVFFVNENVSAPDRVQGQTLMMVASNGLGGVLGNFLAGISLDLGGVPAMLTLSLAACLIATALALAAQRLPKEIER